MILKKLTNSLFRMMPPRFRSKVQSILYGSDIALGHGSYIHPSVHLLGKNYIRVGKNTCVSEGCWLNVNHREGNKLSIDIGNNCFIGKQNFFSSGVAIIIGDYTLTTLGCKFIGSSHKFDNPEVPYILSGTTNEDRIYVGVNCFFGAGVTVLGNIKVGHGSVIGTNSLVLDDVPPFSIAVGSPAKVIKRYSFLKKAWIPSTEISPDIDFGMPSEDDYLEQLKSQFPSVNMPLIAAGKSMGDL